MSPPIRRQPLLRCVGIFFFIVACVGTKPALSGEIEKSIHIAGDVPKPSDWSASQLKKQFASEIKPVQYASRQQQHTSNCIPLLSFLKAAGVQINLKMDPTADPKVKNHPLRVAIAVQGRDGYTVMFSLAELLPDIGNKAAWLAVDVDGNDLPERDGPVKLIVPDDAKPGRWVHGVAAIVVVDGAGATTQPAAPAK